MACNSNERLVLRAWRLIHVQRDRYDLGPLLGAQLLDDGVILKTFEPGPSSKTIPPRVQDAR
eukprot:2889362-Pyramimonas_sp.AAC.1